MELPEYTIRFGGEAESQLLFLRSFCSSVPSALFTGDSIITDREDPYSAFNFILEIDGVKAAGFSEVSGLTTETDVPRRSLICNNQSRH